MLSWFRRKVSAEELARRIDAAIESVQGRSEEARARGAVKPLEITLRELRMMREVLRDPKGGWRTFDISYVGYIRDDWGFREPLDDELIEIARLFQRGRWA
jgi:hypothetical protein